MKGLLSYSGVTTKIRAMEGRFFTDKEFEEIVQLPDVPAVAEYLKKNPGYANALSEIPDNMLHRGMIERYMENSLFRDYEKIYRFAKEDQQIFLRRYARRYEVRLLKQILSAIMQGEHVSEDVLIFRNFFDNYTDLSMQPLYEARTEEDSIKALAKTPYYDTVKGVYNRPEPTLFKYETALDLYHFSTIWHDKDEIGGDKGSAAILTKFYGTKFDMLNLWYIHRAKAYFHMSGVDVYALTIPALYKLKKSDIRALVEAENRETYAKALRATWYGKVYPDLNLDNLQYMYTKICKHVIAREAEKQPYSIATLYYYLYWKEHELYRLTTALECVRYGLKPEESLRYVTRR